MQREDHSWKSWAESSRDIQYEAIAFQNRENPE